MSVMTKALGILGLYWLAAGAGQASTYTFTNTASAGASWFTPENWNSNSVPTGDDTAYIKNNAHAIVDGLGAVAKFINVPYGGSSLATLELQSGSLSNYEIDVAYGAPGQWLITGGASTSYNVRVGYVGAGSGSVVQEAGTVYISSSLYVGNNAGTNSYTLKGGTLKSASAETIGAYANSVATFTQEGGSNTVSANCYLGGAYTGMVCVYTQSAGYFGCLNFRITESAASIGTYYLAGGIFTNTTAAAYEYIGENGNGRVFQSGGTNFGKSIILGKNAGGYGTYSIGKGVLNISPGWLQVGSATGTGVFEVVGASALINANSYTQYPGSTLSIKVSTNGVSPVQVAGNASLDGAIQVMLTDNATPSYSTIVTVMTYSAHSGQFAVTNVATDNPLLNVRVNYNANAVTLDQWRYPLKGTTVVFK